MIFIILLMLSTTAIAGAAAYFSVYGLAYTFSGVFWSVVAMGASLEAGKLIAASYLYRYWTRTSVLLKAYLVAGIAALMFMTSVGIFGYLSSGYQQEILPLNQKTEQVQLLEEERARALERKRQIDDLLAGTASVSTVEGKGGIDNNAVRALRETTRARESLARQYRAEQSDVTKRIKELDSELLTLRQELIQVESHVGPITYIAKALNLPTDDATKYLIFVIIFAFDPMAVALTLAVNTALRIRREEKEAARTTATAPTNAITPNTAQTQETPNEAAVQESLQSQEQLPNEAAVQELLQSQEQLPPDMADVLQTNTWDLYERNETKDLEPLEFTPAVEPQPVQPQPQPQPQPQQEVGSPRRSRPYPNLMTSNELLPSKINELVEHHQYLQKLIDAGQTLSKDEQWEMSAIKDVLRKNGFGHYLK